ncbi:MAG TPA: MFS transporter, partial [Bacteroidales bacterium]|nr:MFS transporter [Bacteroidales bacterium]
MRKEFYRDFKELRKDFRLLIFVGVLFSFAMAISSSFVNVYLWKQTKEWVIMAYYQGIIYFTQMLSFIIGGFLSSYFDRKWLLRFGITLLILFYILVLVLAETANQHLILLGVLLGGGLGLFWLSYNVLTFEITEPNTRKVFNGWFGALTSLSGMFGPLLSGWFIKMFQTAGYLYAFSISLILFLIAVSCSHFFIRKGYKKKFELTKLWVKQHTGRTWRKLSVGFFLQGLREGVYSFAIIIYIFVLTQNEWTIGTYSFFQALCSFITYYLVGNKLKKHHFKQAIFIGGMLLSLAIFLIIFQTKVSYLYLYALLISIGYPLVLIPFLSLTYDIIGKEKDGATHRVEYLVSRDFLVNFGRLSSVLIFILFLS